VLVTSFDPLEIYIFDEFYLRICGSKYDLSDIQDSYKHLTNFSIQKNNSKVTNKAEDLVMSQKEFFQKSLKNDPAKCEKVRKGIEEIIIKTIRTGQESGIEHRPNCFEIYGFDFMLDQKLKPWLLEVNLSPACAERTDFLIKMLDRMAAGLFDHLERRITKVSDDFKGELKTYLSKKKLPNPCWKLIYD
jgi:tubulin monoglycylase TTLL3/8